MFPLAFVAGWLQGHWWGFISRNYVVWPTFILMNVFIALKGSHFWFLFESGNMYVSKCMNMFWLSGVWGEVLRCGNSNKVICGLITSRPSIRRCSRGRQLRSFSIVVTIVSCCPPGSHSLDCFYFTYISSGVCVCGGGGDHTVEAHSRIFLFMNPSVWFGLLDILSMWVLHVRSSEMVTPRYFADETLSSSLSCRKYLPPGEATPSKRMTGSLQVKETGRLLQITWTHRVFK